MPATSTVSNPATSAPTLRPLVPRRPWVPSFVPLPTVLFA